MGSSALLPQALKMSATNAIAATPGAVMVMAVLPCRAACVTHTVQAGATLMARLMKRLDPIRCCSIK
jgi:hypothetical protein